MVLPAEASSKAEFNWSNSPRILVIKRNILSTCGGRSFGWFSPKLFFNGIDAQSGLGGLQ